MSPKAIDNEEKKYTAALQQQWLNAFCECAGGIKPRVANTTFTDQFQKFLKSVKNEGYSGKLSTSSSKRPRFMENGLLATRLL